MSKDKISDYSATANSNTDIAGINIDEGCAPSGINNAIRTLMKQLKDFQQGTNSDSFNGPTNGAHNGTVGATTPAAGTFTTLTASGNVVLGDASTDTLNVGNGGLIKDASGNLGLGVTPSAWVGMQGGVFQNAGSGSLFSRGTNEFCVGFNAYYNSGTGYKYINSRPASNYQQVDGAHQWYNAASGTAGNAITFTQAMTLDASGRLLVGTTSSPSSSNMRAVFQSPNSTSNGGAQYAYSGGGGGAVFSADGAGLSFFSYTGAIGSETYTERARIDSSGNLLVGKTSTSFTSAGAELRAGGIAAFVRDSSSATLYVVKPTATYTTGNMAEFRYNDATVVGTISYTSSSVAYNTSSDYRLKNITGPITNSGDYIDSLNPVEGTWKSDGSVFVGLLAHEAQESSRTPVATGVKDGEEMQAMTYSSPEMIANMIAEIQSLRKRLAAAGIA